MPYRILCNGVQQEGAKLSPALASELFCYVPLHKIRYGVLSQPLLNRQHPRQTLLIARLYPLHQSTIAQTYTQPPLILQQNVQQLLKGKWRLTLLVVARIISYLAFAC